MALPRDIEIELAMARDAGLDGNDGKARVCARRAVAKAYAYSSLSGLNDGLLSSIQCLKIISESIDMTEEIHGAATRLMTSVAAHTGGSISDAPVEDALIIITALLRK